MQCTTYEVVFPTVDDEGGCVDFLALFAHVEADDDLDPLNDRVVMGPGGLFSIGQRPSSSRQHPRTFAQAKTRF